MSRPQSTDDLPKHETEPYEVGRFDELLLTAIPGALVAYGQLVDLVRAADPQVSVEGFRVLRSYSEDALAGKVEDAQRRWDEGKKEYDHWQNTGELPQWRYMLDAYCRAEGLALAPSKAAA